VAKRHHVSFHYPLLRPYRTAVYATWKIAEESYAALSELYDYNEREKINIALADYDDYSNGTTDWTNGASSSGSPTPVSTCGATTRGCATL